MEMQSQLGRGKRPRRAAGRICLLEGMREDDNVVGEVHNPAPRVFLLDMPHEIAHAQVCQKVAERITDGQ